MAIKHFWVYGNQKIPHNHIVINTIADEVVVSSITALDDDSREVEIIDKPTIITKVTSLRYPVMHADRLRITVDHPLVESLSLEDLLHVAVGLENYHTIGKYVSPEAEMGFNSQVAVVYDVKQVLDVFIKCTLHLSVTDNYDNTLYSATVPVSLNDDGFMVEASMDSDEVTLPYEPDPETLYILVGQTRVESFSINGRVVKFSAPSGYECLVIYKPMFLSGSSVYAVTESVSINPQYGLILEDAHCKKIRFSMTVESFNSDVTLINHTPVIKSLGLLTSNR